MLQSQSDRGPAGSSEIPSSKMGGKQEVLYKLARSAGENADHADAQPTMASKSLDSKKEPTWLGFERIQPMPAEAKAPVWCRLSSERDSLFSKEAIRVSKMLLDLSKRLVQQSVAASTVPVKSATMALLRHLLLLRRV